MYKNGCTLRLYPERDKACRYIYGNSYFNCCGDRWQKDFYDHIIRTNEDIVAQVKYILDNPVRKGVVLSWERYPFKGSIGCELEDILMGMI